MIRRNLFFNFLSVSHSYYHVIDVKWKFEYIVKVTTNFEFF